MSYCIKRFMSTNLPPVFTFYSHTKQITNGDEWLNSLKIDCRIFSNLYSSEVIIDSKTYSSTETYFQQYKYSEGDKNFLCALSSMGDVAAFGQRRLKMARKHINLIEQLKEEGKAIPLTPGGEEYKVKDKASPKLAIEDWDIQKIPVMYTALHAKFNQHENLKEMLLNTGDSWLVEHTKNDKQWADGLSGEGMNYLGKLLMKLRDELKESKEYSHSSLDEIKTTRKFDYDYLKKPMDQFLSYPLN